MTVLKNKWPLEDKLTLEACDGNIVKYAWAQDFLAKTRERRLGRKYRNRPSPGKEWWGRHLVREAVLEYGERLKRREYCRILVQNAATGDFCLFQPKYRGQKGYRGRQYARILKLREWTGLRPTAFITCTVDPKRFRSDYEAYRRVRDDWRRMVKRLRRRFKTVEYVLAVEATKSGLPHLHAIVYGVTVKGSGHAKHLGRLLAQDTAGYVKVELCRGGRRGTVAYIAKYLYRDKGPTDAFLSRWRARTLELSGVLRGVMGRLYPDSPSTGVWLFVQVGELDYLEEYGAEGVITLAHMAATHAAKSDGGTLDNALLELSGVAGDEAMDMFLGGSSSQLRTTMLEESDRKRDEYWSPAAVATRAGAA